MKVCALLGQRRRLLTEQTELTYRRSNDELGDDWHCYNFDSFAVCGKS